MIGSFLEGIIIGCVCGFILGLIFLSNLIDTEAKRVYNHQQQVDAIVRCERDRDWETTYHLLIA